MYDEYRPYRHFLMAVDVLLGVVLFALVVKLRPILPGREIIGTSVLPNPIIFFLQALIWHAVFALTGCYDPSRIAQASRFLGRFTFSYILAVCVLSGLLFFTFREISRMLIVYFACINYLVAVLLRFFLSMHLASRRRKGDGSPTIIVGTYGNALRVASRIIGDHGAVLKLVGFVDVQPPKTAQLPKPFLGSVYDIKTIVEKKGIEVVIIARSDVIPGQTHPLPLQRIVYQLEREPVRVYMAPDLFSLALVESHVEKIGDMVLIGLRESLIRGYRRVLKRILDVVLCMLVLVLGWPLFIVIWIMVKLDTKGPGIIALPRVGQNGKIFKMYKFRTMIVGAEDLVEKVATLDEMGDKVYKLRNDPRVTRAGKWLRKFSVDELPQVWNVLRGEMSCVGPRPEQPFLTELYDHWQWQRVSVPPGVTGWWQISGRADLPMHLNTEYDVYYVKNYSILLDLQILFRTIIAIIKAKGAF